MHIQFTEVKSRGEKSGMCDACGKNRVRSTTVYQTLNPYNKNTLGEPKTKAEIQTELIAKIEAWRLEPFLCKCGGTCTPLPKEWYVYTRFPNWSRKKNIMRDRYTSEKSAIRRLKAIIKTYNKSDHPSHQGAEHWYTHHPDPRVCQGQWCSELENQ